MSTAVAGTKARPTTLPGDDDSLRRIERGLSTILRWGNLPRVRERFQSAAGMALDRSSFGVLVRLNEQPMRLSDLAHKVGLDLSTASRQIQHLASAGLVERAALPEDRRAYLLSTTTAGAEMVERILEARRHIITEMLEGWTPDEREELSRVLSHLAQEIVDFGCQDPLTPGPWATEKGRS